MGDDEGEVVAAYCRVRRPMVRSFRIVALSPYFAKLLYPEFSRLLIASAEASSPLVAQFKSSFCTTSRRLW